jgi:hypothetical protein
MITVIGGTYREVCLEPFHNQIFGSGLRAVRLLLENTKEQIKFYTAGNKITKSHIKSYSDVFEMLSTSVVENSELLTFKYNFFLDNPNIYPNIHSLESKVEISVKEDKIICFGMLDANIHLEANKVVFDPQTAKEPVSFINGNTANQLVYIVNSNEARKLSKQKEISDILDYFFDYEKVFALIVKDGPYGAKLFQNKGLIAQVPVYQTNNVFKLGSGDIFTTTFAYHWFNGIEPDLKECIKKASFSTALYCESGNYNNLFNYDYVKSSLNPLSLDTKELSTKTIYLAGPIFTLSDQILVDKIRDCFLDFNVKVFSPYHDIGIGNDEQIASSDIAALKDSDIVFALLDGLDSGTFIELGYAMAIGKNIIGYNKLEDDSSLLMLQCSKINVYNDLTTAIYQTIWNL